MPLVLLKTVTKDVHSEILVRADDVINASWNAELQQSVVSVRLPYGSVQQIYVCETLEQIMRKVNS